MPSPTSILGSSQLADALAVRDLTDPGQGGHAIQLLVETAVVSLATTWSCEVRWHRGPRVVPVEENYDRLRIPLDAVSRDVRYTRYVDERRLLRSHSTAMIPAALRALAAEPSDDVLLVCPAVVYRRDTIDRLHAPTPHQLDLWRITRRPLGHADLREMVRLLVEALAPGRPYREEPRLHPYTLDGRQVDICWDSEWIEVWECGLAHPAVLEAAGLLGWSGLALGMGLDRLLMLRKGVPDIRLLRSADPRIAGQMTDLSPYRPVSAMPPVRRDVSIAVEADDTVERLGDRVRDALGPDADAVEEVAVLAETPQDRLSPKAVARLGIGPHQKNVLGPGHPAPPRADADRRGGQPGARPRLRGPAPGKHPPVGSTIAIDEAVGASCLFRLGGLRWLRIRSERSSERCSALAMLACSVICFRSLQQPP